MRCLACLTRVAGLGLVVGGMLHSFVGWSGEALREPLLNDAFEQGAGQWEAWAPRDEISPRLGVDAQVGHDSSGSLRIDAGGDAAAFGAWKCRVEGFKPGVLYRLEAWYRAEGVDNTERSILPRLMWLDDRGRWARPPEFASAETGPRDGDWRRVTYLSEAPESAVVCEVQLGFGFAADGRVWWDDVSFAPVEAGPSRVVRVATIHHQPRGLSSAEESVDVFAALVERAAKERPDIICLPEGITVVGNPQNYVDVSEPVPGPTTQRLGELAEAHRCYIVAGIYERVGKRVYNTAVLMDRAGQLAGRYRKTHLPREEWEAGLTPGDEYPVFDTDFGKIGIMVCWDVQFPEPARAMALKGAEMLFLPIWGGRDVLTQARAIENHVFMVSSSYNMRSYIVDPIGNILSEATDENPIAVTELRLDQKHYQDWLGNMATRTWKERRPDIPVDPR